jgi:phosphopantetheinyl transferase
MNAAPKISHWPEMPALPPPGQPVLVRVVTGQSRPAARRELRDVLRQVLAAWSSTPPEQLPLRETASGPAWSGQLDGHGLDINFSYTEGEGWIGLCRAGLIGVDAMRIRQIPESEEVARHYLGHAALAAIQQSSDPAMTFAMAWTELEARLKCLKQGLDEWPIAQKVLTARCAIQTMLLPGHLVVTVATTSAR